MKTSNSNISIGSKGQEVKLLLLATIILFSVLPLANANLGTFKQNECVPIRVLANCSNINLVEVTINNKDSFIINSPMQNIGGQTFNYTFCDTAELGTYSYSWDNPCLDCGQGDCGNDFTITPSGYSGTLGFYLILLAIVVVIIGAGFYMEDEWLTILGAIACLFLGLLIFINGIDIIKDTTTTDAVAMIVWGVSIYIFYKSVASIIEKAYS